MNVRNKFCFAIGSALLTLAVGDNAEHVRVSAQNTRIDQFMVGVLRANGTLVPFAEYRHGLWWNPWPEPALQTEGNEVRPKSLGNHHEPWFRQCERTPTTWYFRSSARSTLALRALETLQVENHSQTNWALMTDYPKKQNAGIGSHNYVGIALNVDLKVEGMVEIESGRYESNSIVAHVKAAFDNSETAEVARSSAQPATSDFWRARGFPSSNEERAKAELVVTKLFRSKSAIDGQHIYYVEVEKRYRNPAHSPDSPCDNISFLKGWVLKDRDGTLGILNDSFGITNCDGKERGGSVELFSVMAMKNRTFLFTVEHGWEDESYTIYEFKDSWLARALETFGG